MINGSGDMELAIAEKQTQMGGDWFFWIAGLSILNSVLQIIHSPVGVFFGLGTTDIFNRFGADAGGSGKIIVLLMDVVAAGFYVLYGAFARKGAKWAFIVGMVFYVIDALIVLLLTKQYLEVAAHAYALFRIFQGFQGAQRLGVLRVQRAAMASGAYGPSPSAPGNDVWPPPPSV